MSDLNDSPLKVPESTGRIVASSDGAQPRFPPDVILLAVGWYLRYGLSY